jgi:hypothetical protein
MGTQTTFFNKKSGFIQIKERVSNISKNHKFGVVVLVYFVMEAEVLKKQKRFL